MERSDLLSRAACLVRTRFSFGGAVSAPRQDGTRERPLNFQNSSQPPGTRSPSGFSDAYILKGHVTSPTDLSKQFWWVLWLMEKLGHPPQASQKGYGRSLTLYEFVKGTWVPLGHFDDISHTWNSFDGYFKTFRTSWWASSEIFNRAKAKIKKRDEVPSKLNSTCIAHMNLQIYALAMLCCCGIFFPYRLSDLLPTANHFSGYTTLDFRYSAMC